MDFWGIWINGVWVTGMSVNTETNRAQFNPDLTPKDLPPLDIDDSLRAHQILAKAKTLADLFEVKA